MASASTSPRYPSSFRRCQFELSFVKDERASRMSCGTAAVPRSCSEILSSSTESSCPLSWPLRMFARSVTSFTSGSIFPNTPPRLVNNVENILLSLSTSISTATTTGTLIARRLRLWRKFCPSHQSDRIGHRAAFPRSSSLRSWLGKNERPSPLHKLSRRRERVLIEHLMFSRQGRPKVLSPLLFSAPRPS